MSAQNRAPNAHVSSYALGERIERVVAHQASQRPLATAVQQAQRIVSYGELLRQSEVFAAALHAYGIGPTDHVAIRMSRSPELVIGLLGILRAGAAYVVIEPHWPPGRVDAVIRDTATALLVTQDSEAVNQESERTIGFAALLERGMNAPIPRPMSDGTQTACVFYTSGSTGRPKGILSPHRGTIRTLVNCPTIPLDEDTVFLQAAPLAWDGLSLELWAPLLNGGCCVLLDQDTSFVDAEALDKALQRGVNSLWLTSSLFNVIAEERSDIFGRIRLLLVGGERVSVASTRRVVTKYPGLHMVNGYGPAEGTIFATNHVISREDIRDGSTEIPIGTALPQTTVVLLDSARQPVADGCIGEIAVGGDGVALGYADNDEETERKFFTRDGARFYLTGDLAIRDTAGRLLYRGRADRQVKIRGIRVELDEIEAVLENHPDVTASCVLALHVVLGRVELAAAYTTADGLPIAAGQLAAYAGHKLLAAMVPTVIHHVAALPLTAHGKADRVAVQELLLARLALPVSDSEGSLAGPDGDAVLGLARTVLRAHHLTEIDDIILAGASSLDVIQLAAAIGKHADIHITASDLYDLRTPQAIASYCAISAIPRERLPPILSDGISSAPLSHAQRRFWISEMMSPGAADNMIVLAYLLSGPLDLRALEAAVNDVIALHPTLRTVYQWQGLAPVQRILDPAEAHLTLQHCSQPAEACAAPLREVAEAVTADWWSTPFVLDEDIPIRARICQLAEHEYLLCLHVHHVAFDGWSESIFISDLCDMYDARLAGRALTPPPRLSYGQFSTWESTRLDDWRDRELPFWRDRMARLPAPFLPAPAEPLSQSARSERSLSVDRRVAKRISEMASRHRGPALTVFIAAAGRALSRTFDAPDLALGSVTNGRFDPVLEPMVGVFVNSFVVGLESVDVLSAPDLLDQSVSRVVGALRNVHLPFDDLVRALAPPRARHPWYQACAILQRQPPSGRLGAQVAVEPVHVRPPATQNELVIEAAPVVDGSWDLVVSWREDGIDEVQAEQLMGELSEALREMAGL